MLTNAQELELVDRLPLQPEDRWLALLYRAKCKKVGRQRVFNRRLATGLGRRQHSTAVATTSCVLVVAPCCV